MKSKGFSLIEILVGTAIMGGLFLTSAQLLEQRASMASIYEEELESVFLHNDIRSFLTSVEVCTKNFQGFKADNNSPLTQLVDVNGNTRFSKDIKRGSKNVFLDSVTLGDGSIDLFKSDEDDQGFAKLQLNIETTTFKAFSSKNIIKPILLKVKLDKAHKNGGVIQECSLASGSNVATGTLWKPSPFNPLGIYYDNSVVVGKAEQSRTLGALEIIGDVNVVNDVLEAGPLYIDQDDNVGIGAKPAEGASGIKRNVFFAGDSYEINYPNAQDNVVFSGRGSGALSNPAQGQGCSVSHGPTKNVIIGQRTWCHNPGDENVCIGNGICNTLRDYCKDHFQQNVIIGNGAFSNSDIGYRSNVIGSFGLSAIMELRDSISIGAANVSGGWNQPAQAVGGMDHTMENTILVGKVLNQFIASKAVKFKNNLIIHPNASRTSHLYRPYHSNSGDDLHRYEYILNIGNLLNGTFYNPDIPEQSEQVFIGRPKWQVHNTEFPSDDDDTEKILPKLPPQKNLNPNIVLEKESPKTRLIVYGKMKAKDFDLLSDARLKEDVRKIHSSLPKVLKLNGYKYDKFVEGKFEESSGVIADEVQNLLPRLVVTQGPYQAVKYGELIAYFVDSMQEIAKRKMELKEKIEKLLDEIDNYEE